MGKKRERSEDAVEEEQAQVHGPKRLKSLSAVSGLIDGDEAKAPHEVSFISGVWYKAVCMLLLGVFK